MLSMEAKPWFFFQVKLIIEICWSVQDETKHIIQFSEIIIFGMAQSLFDSFESSRAAMP